MDLPDAVTNVIDMIQESAGVDRVYGDSIERDGRTVVPVARVAYGFGGGFGEGSSGGETADDEAGPTEQGSGGGGGGGVMATPIGALEISDEETRFVRFDERKRLVGAVALGILLGWLVGRGRD